MGLPYAASIAPGMVIAALGSVSVFILLMQAATAPLPPAEQGVGTALLFTAQQVGTGLGATISLMLLDPGGGTLVAADFRLPFLVLAGGIGIALSAMLAFGPSAARPNLKTN